MSVFLEDEYKARVIRAQKGMAERGLGALLLTTEAEIRYFTGFLTRFWESPSRPWFLVVPSRGKPVAVIPSIGAALMGKTWLDDIRTWSSPDLTDDGVSLLRDCLQEVAGPGLIGMPMGRESTLRMPLTDYDLLEAELGTLSIVSDGGLTAELRAIKSEAEIACIREACAIAGRAFHRVPEIARPGVPLAQVFRRFQMLCLEEGADWVPYLAGGVGPLGYDDVISPASEAPLQAGDVLMLDTGLVRQGYFSDFDRNWAIGHAAPEALSAWRQLLEATEAARAIARPGTTASELYHAMHAIVGGGEAGRLGHGLGMQLTEGLSLIAADQTELRPGMVITLEPGITLPGGGIMVHEDVFAITEAGCDQLSPPAPPDLPVLA
ncbi:M24 family metallopeptidase [Pacificoceanicola onchidii]|uniref:M24 family metallopeptidase n=1 Tax=Pacificoceanicola onchidii TaxID=2562685 RepID=UPI0010A4B403|nr:Xaa-Pro peptidase family protein [Pacificoceanicola onchidii]